MFVFAQLLRHWPACKIHMVLSFDGMLILTFTVHFESKFVWYECNKHNHRLEQQRSQSHMKLYFEFQSVIVNMAQATSGSPPGSAALPRGWRSGEGCGACLAELAAVSETCKDNTEQLWLWRFADHQQFPNSNWWPPAAPTVAMTLLLFHVWPTGSGVRLGPQRLQGTG